MSEDITFTKMHDDGHGNMTVTDERTLKRSDILACPFVIMMPEHYNADGSCKCYEAEEQYRMYHEWEYRKADFARRGIPYLLGPRGKRL